jgi:hypothetical protein
LIQIHEEMSGIGLGVLSERLESEGSGLLEIPIGGLPRMSDFISVQQALLQLILLPLHRYGPAYEAWTLRVQMKGKGWVWVEPGTNTHPKSYGHGCKDHFTVSIAGKSS